MKKQILINKDFINQILPLLLNLGYKEIINRFTGGDDDFIIIDITSKEFAWFENGDLPINDMEMYFSDKTITGLIKESTGLNFI